MGGVFHRERQSAHDEAAQFRALIEFRSGIKRNTFTVSARLPLRPQADSRCLRLTLTLRRRTAFRRRSE